MTTATVISLIISGVMMVIGIVTFIITISTNSRKDGATLAKIQATLEGLALSVADIKSDLKDMLKATTELDKRVSALESEVEYLKSLTCN